MAKTRGDRTRASVLAAATERFRRQGFTGTTAAEVAADAGVAEGTVFLHFGNKAGLLIAVMQSYYDDLADDVSRVAEQPGTAEERLRRLLEHWLERMETDWPLVAVFGQHGRFAVEGEIPQAFVAMNRRITRIVGGVIEDLKVQGAIRQELPTRLLRDVVFGTIEHTIISRIHTGRPEHLDGIVDGLLELLLRGAATPTHGVSAGASLESVERKIDEVLERLGR